MLLQRRQNGPASLRAVTASAPWRWVPSQSSSNLRFQNFDVPSHDRADLAAVRKLTSPLRELPGEQGAEGPVV